VRRALRPSTRSLLRERRTNPALGRLRADYRATRTADPRLGGRSGGPRPFALDDSSRVPKGLASLCSGGLAERRRRTSSASSSSSRTGWPPIRSRQGAKRARTRTGGPPASTSWAAPCSIRPQRGLALSCRRRVHAALGVETRPLLRLVQLDRQTAITSAEDLSMGCSRPLSATTGRSRGLRRRRSGSARACSRGLGAHCPRARPDRSAFGQPTSARPPSASAGRPRRAVRELARGRCERAGARLRGGARPAHTRHECGRDCRALPAGTARDRARRGPQRPRTDFTGCAQTAVSIWSRRSAAFALPALADARQSDRCLPGVFRDAEARPHRRRARPDARRGGENHARGRGLVGVLAHRLYGKCKRSPASTAARFARLERASAQGLQHSCRGADQRKPPPLQAGARSPLPARFWAPCASDGTKAAHGGSRSGVGRSVVASVGGEFTGRPSRSIRG